RAQHVDVAVGEVQQLDDPVDHAVAESDESVERADDQTVPDELHHGGCPSASRDADRGGAAARPPRMPDQPGRSSLSTKSPVAGSIPTITNPPPERVCSFVKVSGP